MSSSSSSRSKDPAPPRTLKGARSFRVLPRNTGADPDSPVDPAREPPVPLRTVENLEKGNTVASAPRVTRVKRRGGGAPVPGGVGGVVAQVRTAFEARNRLPTTAGFLLGGLVPLATFILAHREISSITDPKSLLVTGGLLFSAKTVYEWARLAFRNPLKATGFVILLEGVMVFSSTEWLTWVTLGYLVMINGIATGCILSLPEE